MSHLRQQIRERIATTLTGLTTTGTNVFQSRVFPVEQTELPALLIYSESEDVALDEERASMGAVRTISRDLTVVIEAYCTGIANTDDTLDTICKEIEVAMQADIGINNLATDSYLQSVQTEFSGEGQQPIAAAMLRYQIHYRNAENNPEVAS